MRIKPVSKLVKIAVLIALIWAPSTLICQHNKSAISKAFNDFNSDEAMASASVGLSIVDIATGEQVFGYDENRRLTPASSQKMLVATTMLEVLGPDHQFNTVVYAQGSISNGTLTGNLVVVAQGDPTLGSAQFSSASAFLDSIVTGIRNAGIKEILGQIIIDDTYFSGETLAGSTSVADAGNYYAAGSSAFHYRDNQFSIVFSSPETAGERTRVVKTIPDIPYLTIENTVVAANTKLDNAYIHSVPGSDHLIIRGTIPRNESNFAIDAALHEPDKLFTLELIEALGNAGIQFTITEIKALGDTVEIMTSSSPPLSEILAHMLRTSDNSYADCMLQHLGKNLNENGSFEGGIDGIQTYWGARGLAGSEWRQEDGSGLSRANAISARQMTFVIAHASLENRKVLLKGLKPLGGNSAIQVKSGYISGVRAYAGFISGKSGKEYAFTIMVNNHNQSASAMRREIETLMGQIQLLL